MSVQTADVIVVGAGLSGLTAAWRLAWAGRDVRVIEAAPRIGGRILTGAFATGQRVELGADGVGAGQTGLRQLLGELDLALDIPCNPGPAALPQDAALPWPGRWQLQRLWGALERQAMLLPVEPAAEHMLAQLLDQQSLADWLRPRWLGQRARQSFEEGAGLLFGAAPQDLSLLQALLQLRRHGGRSGLSELRLGLNQWRPAAGMQAICRRLTARLGDALILDTPLLALQQDGQAVELLTSGARYRARRVVLAVPALQLAGLGFAPALPGWRAHALRHLLPQATLEARLRYARPFWRERLPHVALPHGRADCLLAELPEPGSGEGCLRVRLAGERAQRCLQLSAAPRRALLLETLAAVLGEPARTPVECLLHCWTEQPFLHCAAPHWAVGGWSLQAPLLRRPLGRVHFAGADLALRWPGTLEGAVEAGERAAEEVLGQGERLARSLDSP